MTLEPGTAPSALAGAWVYRQSPAKLIKACRATRMATNRMYFSFLARRILFQFWIPWESVWHCLVRSTECHTWFISTDRALRDSLHESNVGHGSTTGSATGVQSRGTM